jgi:oxysterol-binding protein-related protein 8
MPGQDLTRVTIPSFFLEPRSLLERMADTQMHPDLLLGVADLPDPVDRMKAIVKWYLSGWHYKTVGVKKPFNPIVGETFACYWKHADGSRSQYFAEQVSHRPPISGIYFENRRHNVVASSHVWTKSQFSAPQTTKSILDGACVLKLTNRGPETYYITFPTYYAHNLLLGTLRMEVGDVGHIVCEATGLRADIEFTQKPMFGGADRLNGLNGIIKRTTGAGGAKDLFHVTGHWDSVMYIAPADARASKEVLLDVGAEVVSPKHVLPLELQGPWESRRLWRWASGELAARPVVNWSAVDREKAQLEEEQRLLPCHHHGGHGRSKEHTDGWETKKFHKKTVRDPLTGACAPCGAGGDRGGVSDHGACVRSNTDIIAPTTPPTPPRRSLLRRRYRPRAVRV